MNNLFNFLKDIAGYNYNPGWKEYFIFVSILLFSCYIFSIVGTKLKNWKHKNKIGYALAISLIFVRISRTMFFILTGTFTIQDSLPFHICHISSWCLILFIFTRKEYFYSIGFFWGAIGSIFGSLYPDTAALVITPLSLTYYMQHILMWYIVIYLLNIEQIKPKLDNALFCMKFTALFGIVMTAFDILTKSNYAYLLYTPRGNTFFDTLGYPLYTITVVIIFIAYVGIYYLSFHIKDNLSLSTIFIKNQELI